MTGSPALAVYLAASRLAGPLAHWLLARRMAAGREDPLRLGERIAAIPGVARPSLPAVYDLDGVAAVPHLRFVRSDLGARGAGFAVEFRPAQPLGPAGFAFGDAGRYTVNSVRCAADDLAARRKMCAERTELGE